MDDSFVEWALATTTDDIHYWATFTVNFPACEDNFNLARHIIQSCKISHTKGLPANEIDEIIKNVNNRILKQKQPSFPFSKLGKSDFLRVAAMLILIISAGLLLVKRQQDTANPAISARKTADAIKKIKNNGKAPMLVKLPDNSSVVLQPMAVIKYPVAFKGATRQVSLNGEAFFEVAKNAKKPFYVRTNELTIRVVGTSFKVNANDNDDQFKVLVSTGRVEVFANHAIDYKKIIPVVLTPNQQVVLYRKNSRLETSALNKPMLLSKKSTAIHFNFTETPFSKVISTIEEAYGVHIIYDEKVMGNCQLTASLIDQTLDERLKLICQAVEAEYTITGGQIKIEGKGCGI